MKIDCDSLTQGFWGVVCFWKKNGFAFVKFRGKLNYSNWIDLHVLCDDWSNEHCFHWIIVLSFCDNLFTKHFPSGLVSSAIISFIASAHGHRLGPAGLLSAEHTGYMTMTSVCCEEFPPSCIWLKVIINMAQHTRDELRKEINSMYQLYSRTILSPKREWSGQISSVLFFNLCNAINLLIFGRRSFGHRANLNLLKLSIHRLWQRKQCRHASSHIQFDNLCDSVATQCVADVYKKKTRFLIPHHSPLNHIRPKIIFNNFIESID